MLVLLCDNKSAQAAAAAAARSHACWLCRFVTCGTERRSDVIIDCGSMCLCVCNSIHSHSNKARVRRLERRTDLQGRAGVCPGVFIESLDLRAENRDRRPRFGRWGSWGRATSPSPPALGERCELPQRSSEQSPDRPKVFYYFQHSG